MWNRKETQREKFHTLTKQHPWQVRAAGICQRDAREEIQARIHTHTHRFEWRNTRTHAYPHLLWSYPKLNAHVSFLLMTTDTHVSNEKNCLMHLLHTFRRSLNMQLMMIQLKTFPLTCFPNWGSPQSGWRTLPLGRKRQRRRKRSWRSCQT